jgi:outer membrane protein assembly factor BamC
MKIINISIYITLLMLTACSNMGSSEYSAGFARPTSDLAVPPGLSSPDVSGGLKMLPAGAVNEGYHLNQVKDMQIIQGGSERYLAIKGKTVNQVWPMMQAYLNQAGLSIKYQNQTVGIIQTDWVSKNNIVKENDVRAFFDWVGWGSMYSLQSQFMFRVNLWQNGADTQVFVTIYQMNEVYAGCAKYLNQSIRVNNSDNQVPIWMPMPPDPKLELEFLMKFMAFAGLGKEQVKQVESQVAAQAAPTGPKAASLQGSTLVINDTFDRSWWRSGLALERVGLGVTDKNRSLGEYYVYPLQSQVDNPEPGFLDRWFGSSKSNLQIPKAMYTVKLISKTPTVTNLEISLYSGAQDKDFAKHQAKYLADLLKQLE